MAYESEIDWRTGMLLRHQDPRPDLEEDHHLWVKVLTEAYRRNVELFGVLHGLRCMETRIEKTSTGYRLKVPYAELAFDKPGRKNGIATRKKWLDPHRDEIVGLLSLL